MALSAGHEGEILPGALRADTSLSEELFVQVALIHAPGRGGRNPRDGPPTARLTMMIVVENVSATATYSASTVPMPSARGKPGPAVNAI